MASEYLHTKSAISIVNLAAEVETSLSKKILKTVPADTAVGFITYTNDGSTDNLCFSFDTALTSQEETDLGTAVTAHTA